MAYGALVSGLIGAGMAAGDQAGKNMDEARKVAEEQRHKAGALDLYRAEHEMQLEFDRRKEEIKIAQQKAQGQAIETGAQGILGAKTEAAVQDANAQLKAAEGYGTPGVTSEDATAKFIRDEKGFSPLETAQARSQAAGNLGILSIQKEYNDQIKDINTAELGMNRYKETVARDQQRHEEVMAAAERANTVATNNANKTLEAAQIHALSEGINTTTSEINRIRSNMTVASKDPMFNAASPPADYVENANELKRLSTKQESWMNTLAKHGGVETPKTAIPAPAPQAAIDALKNHPEKKDEFKNKYGYVPAAKPGLIDKESKAAPKATPETPQLTHQQRIDAANKLHESNAAEDRAREEKAKADKISAENVQYNADTQDLRNQLANYQRVNPNPVKGSSVYDKIEGLKYTIANRKNK